MADTFKEFRASELFCPSCRVVRPVRERLLLVLPGTGEKHDLFCAACGELVGERTTKDVVSSPSGVVVAR